MRRLLLTLVLACVAMPAQAGRALLVRCPQGGFETQVMEGRGFAEAALGLTRTPLWCPGRRAVETAWVAGDDAAARELSRLAASDAPDSQPVTVTPERALERLGLTTVGRLRARLAVPRDGALSFGGESCQPLARFYGEPFPLCDGSPLEMRVLPRVWD